MAHIIPRRVPYVCKSCQSTQLRNHVLRQFSTTTIQKTSLRQQLHERSPEITSTKRTSVKQKLLDRRDGTSGRGGYTAQTARQQSRTEEDGIGDPKQVLKEIQMDTLVILESGDIPKESAVQEIISRAQKLADALVHVPDPNKQQQIEHQQRMVQQQTEEDPASLLSDLNESQSRRRAISKPFPEPQTDGLSTSDRETYAAQLARTIYTLLEDPKIFISERLLTSYTSTITTLSLPEYLPSIFRLYANKPIPVPGSSNPIKYRTPYSRAPKYAIPLRVADQAITSAINRRDLPLSITLIDLTVNTPSYFYAKFLRKAALPLLGASSVIPLSYSLSNSAAMYQLSWDPDTFFWMCMAGSTAYLGTMGTLLWITVTTWNDHHKRVRWVPGTPLSKRWFREEERMYFDRVAQAWGFQDENRHGEETGEEWEALREVLGVRYLEMDRSSLLPGML